MNEHHDQQPDVPPVDATRRRLTKAGLAAPAVLGVLASRPVLGNTMHHCTPSGHISGFASQNTHTVACSTLGHTPTYYAGGTGTWPNATSDWLDGTNPRPLKLTPYSLADTKRFPEVFKKEKTAGVNNFTADPVGTKKHATVWDVLKGFVVNPATGLQDTDWELFVVNSTFDLNTSLVLGQEAIAACMNAKEFGGSAGHPLTPEEVVVMFKAVINGGTYVISSSLGQDWNAAEVLAYWQTLRG